ncbi:hypothetical protein GCM10023176_36260 [Micromonospora coerulea]|uniref:AMIN-like domain-containing protein n=1 Tax=Micromonospora coerulea TaxID=47856 RepID=A0ABP8SQN5_9ACTN
MDRVESDGSGDPVDLPGDAYLSIRFDPAQGHFASGRLSYTAPARAIGNPTLRGRAPAGGFEGRLGFGLGLRTTGVPLPVRLAESPGPTARMWSPSTFGPADRTCHGKQRPSYECAFIYDPRYRLPSWDEDR